RIRFVAQPREQFDAWAQQQRLGSLTAAATPADAQQASLVARGQPVFLTNTCVNCHTIQGTAASGTVGPDLTHVGSRTTLGAGVTQNTPADMRRWVQDARAVKPGALMPPFALSDADLDALVAYLEGLE
ncbi:MAG TPA: c-type cytochrome, partial [Chloroflexota bacterium]|nr:c-type cytochrome [Chloroflexota bacterium]